MENHESSSFDTSQNDQSSLKPNETDDAIVDSDDEQFLCGYGRLIYFPSNF